MRIQKYTLIIILIILHVAFPESQSKDFLDSNNNLYLSSLLNGNSSWIINWDNYSWVVKAVVSDPSENIYCAGVIDPNPPGYYGPSEADSFFISKFNSSGIEEWNLEFDNNYTFLDLEIDSNNNIYTLWEINYEKSLLLKLDSSGNSLWNYTFIGNFYDFYVDNYKNSHFWEYGMFDDFLRLSILNESGDIQYNYTFSIDFPLSVSVDELNNTFISSYTYPKINLHKVNSSGELILVKEFDQPPDWDYFFFGDKGNLYSIGITNSYSNNLYKYNRSGFELFNITWKSFHRGAYQSFWRVINFDNLGNIYCAGLISYFSLIYRSEIFLTVFTENGTLIGEYIWRKFNDASIRNLHIDQQNNIYFTGFSEKGQFLAKNPALDDYSINIFHFSFDEEILSVLMPISIFFSVWSLLGISLYVLYYKKGKR